MSVLTRLAARRPHVLPVVAAGSAPVRVALEAGVAARRWVLADSPADADVLVLAGRVGPRLSAVADAVFAAVPAPRVRTRARTPRDVDRALDDAAGRLLDGGTAPPAAEPETGADGESAPMADLAADDRDGLALDALHVPLGPALPAWPAGLVVHAVLAGDVITEAVAEVLDVPAGSPARRTKDELDADRARLDALAGLLALAGADRAARRARRLRDGSPDLEDLTRFARAVGRSRVLHRLLRTVPLSGTDDVHAAARLRRWTDALGTGAPDEDRPTPDAAVAALVGLELGTARLALAALDPDTALGAGPVGRVRADDVVGRGGRRG